MTKINQHPANAFYAPTLLPAIEELLARGIERERIEAVFRRSLFELRTPFMRVPLLLSRRFWALAQAHSKDPSIGLSAGRRFLTTSTNGLTYLFDAASSLQSACGYFVEYFPFLNGHFRAEVVPDGQAVELRLHDCGSLRATPAISDYVLISICSMVRRKLLASGLAQEPIISIGLAHPPPFCSASHEHAFRVPVLWQQKPYHAIRLDAQLFGQALTPGNHELEETLVGLLQQTQANSHATLLELLCDHLLSEPLGSTNLQGFCATQHLVDRTVARRLKALGWNFSELLDEYRRYRAEDLLCEQRLELAEISDQLGYSDVQSFNRACLRWFECTPGLYRANLSAASKP